MIKGYKSQLMDMYEKIRQKEKSNLANRQKELKEKLPQVFEYEREINKLSLKLSMLALRKHEKESFEKLKKEIENLLKIKIDKLNIYNRYDLEISDENLDKAINNVLSERNLDYVYA
ncbi:MAG: hypothetical protein E6303_14150, partial [Clostridium perfringens]|nr:hypothetical protein [Clostridium perfringens]